MSAIWRTLRTLIAAWLAIAATPIRVVRAPLPPEIADLDPGDVDTALEWGEVFIQGELGRMPAWLVYPPYRKGAPRKYMIFVHGRGGTRIGSLDMIKPMVDLGYICLVISYRNDLEGPSSPDGFDHLGDTEWSDLEAAVEWALNDNADEVVIFARSAGAAIVGQYLSRSDTAPRINRVIFDNPVLDWTAVFMNARPSWLPKWVARLMIWGCAHRIKVWMPQFHLGKNPPVHRPPLLIIHAVDDDVCPIEMVDDFEIALMRSHTIWKGLDIYPTFGGHAGGRFADENYLPEVQHFLTQGKEVMV